MGETLPFLVSDRIDWAYINPNISKLPGFIKERPSIKKTPSEMLLDNVFSKICSGNSEKLGIKR